MRFLPLILGFVGNSLQNNLRHNLQSHPLQNSFSYELCNTYQAFKIDSVELLPSAPVKGRPLTLNVKGFLEKDVTDGSKLMVFFKFMRIDLFRKRYDICNELDNTDDAPMKCPIQTGKKTWSYTFDIPNNMPNGNYEIYANITNPHGELLVCSKINFSLLG